MQLTVKHQTIEAIEVALVRDGKPTNERAFVVRTPDGTTDLIDADILLTLFRPVCVEVHINGDKPDDAADKALQEANAAQQAANATIVAANELNDKIQKQHDETLEKLHSNLRSKSAPKAEALPADYVKIGSAIREALANGPLTVDELAARIPLKHPHITEGQVRGNVHACRVGGFIEIDQESRGLGTGVKWRLVDGK
jgi:hypothetical protein